MYKNFNFTKNLKSNELLNQNDFNEEKKPIRLIILLLINFSVYVNFYQFFAVSSYPFTLFDISYILLIIYSIYELFWLKKSIIFPKTVLISSLFLLLIVFFISISYPLYSGNSTFIFQFFKTYLHFIYLVALALILIGFGFSKYELNQVIKMLIYTSIIVNIFGIYQIFARILDLPLAFIEFNNINVVGDEKFINEIISEQAILSFGNFYRVTSVFSEPSAIAAYNCLIFILLFIPVINNVNSFIKNKLIYNISLILCLLNLFLAFSNTGLFTFFCIFLIIIFIDKKIKLSKFLYYLFSFIIIIIISDLLIYEFTGTSVLELFTQRLYGIIYYIFTGNNQRMTNGESFDTRADNFVKMIEIWNYYPLTGIGLGMIKNNGLYDLKYSEHFLSSVIAEVGLQGLLVFVFLFVVLIYYGYSITKNYQINTNIEEEDKNLYSILLYLILIVIITNWISANQFIASHNWIIFSIIYGIINNYLRDNNMPFIKIDIFNKSKNNLL